VRIPPDSPRGRRIWLALGRAGSIWIVSVIGVVLTAFVVLLVLHFAGVIQLADD
jgi:hypothetical protein